MRHGQKFKTAIAGLVAVGALALSATAQAVTLDAGVFTAGRGGASSPIVINVPDPGNPGVGSLFTDTVNFDLGSFTHFNMTSTFNNITAFGSTIFENNGDAEIPLENGYSGAASTFTELPLANLGLPRDYHLHPAGLEAAGSSYELRLWGSMGSPVSPPAVPLPAAAWLFGSGVIGLVGLARRKMMA